MSGSAERFRETLALHAGLSEGPALRITSRSGSRRVIGWRELAAASDRAACGLARLATDAPLIVSLPSCAEFVIVLIAALGSGRSLLVVPPNQSAAALRRLAEAAGGLTWLGLPGDPRAAELESLRFVPIDDVLAGAGPTPRAAGAVPTPRAAGAVLLPTTGTTGRPKLVRRGLRALLAVGEACTRGIPVERRDRILLAIPLCHSYGIDQLMSALVSGATLDLHASFEPAGVLRALREDEITSFPAVPVMLDVLARSIGALPAPRLRRVISAGSALRKTTFDRFENVFGLPIGQLYGATELGSATYNPPEREGFDPMAVGFALPGVEIRILDPADPDPAKPQPAGSEGVVAVAAPSLLDGYHGDERAVLRAGFFVTGDLGSLDAHGVLRLSGRRDLLLDVGARKVDPLEVEAVLCRYPGVREAAVVPLAAGAVVTRLRAVIVPEPGIELDGAKLRRFARSCLPHYMVPRAFEMRSELPRSAAGKVLRSELLATEGIP